MTVPDYVREQARYELARRNFWEYCKLKAPDFYIEDKIYLKNFCNQLQEFYFSDEKVMVVNMPPRHGKSRTATLFVQWLLGNFIHLKVMTGSYNEDLSGTFAKAVRDAIQEVGGVFGKVFPCVNVKYGDATMKKWALEGNEEANYLATSPTGTATGFGCNIMIIDDVIKNVYEAYNAAYLKKIIEWFTDTMLSRTETGFKILIIMTRWVSDDLAGFILSKYPKARHINYKAIQEDGSMLCESVLTREDLDFKVKDMSMSKEIFYANYQQEPIDLEGRLYKSFKTYSKLPTEYTKIKNYTDTADTGDDYLCSIDYVEYNKEAYVINLIYTKDGMEITEPAVAKMLFEDGVNVADVESNNGGRGFARNVERILRETYHSNKCKINWFHQSKNKQARINSNSTWVMNHIYFPENWADRFPEYYESMNRYQKEGKNEHDDAQDATTGVAEKTGQDSNFSFY